MPKDEAVAGPSKAQAKITPDPVELNTLLKFVNKFDGSRDKLNSFLNNCKNAVSLGSSSQQEILLKYILTQLEGRAESACVIKDFDNWAQLEEYLKSQFGEKKHYAALLSDLQECRQANLETVNQFALRVEFCLAKLLTEINISIPTKKKGELAGRLAAMQDLATHTFITGLNPQLSTVVRCRDPETLNEAINCAVSEEKISLTTIKRNSNGPVNQNQGRFPHNLNQGRFPHNQNQGRFPQNLNQGRFTQNQYQGRFPQNQTRPYQSNQRQWSSAQPRAGPSYAHQENSYPGTAVCRYCKAPGHTIDVCRKRQYANRFNSSDRTQPIHAIEEHIGADTVDCTADNENNLND